jgi:Epoxide hydrolase N terminus
MMSITPYTIAIPQADLDDLKARLAHVRWTNELPGVDTDYGVPLDSVKRLVEYWQEGYDWRTWEAKLNVYPQFTTTIDGQNIHFLHVRSQEDNALPLILTHGWPMSVLDYLDLIDPLIDPRSHGGEASQAFHLVIPSLPGFGFSGPTTERGWDRFRVARAWAELMRRLGYDRYGAHGMVQLSPRRWAASILHMSLVCMSPRSSPSLPVTRLSWKPCLSRKRSSSNPFNGGLKIRELTTEVTTLPPRQHPTSLSTTLETSFRS